MADFDGGRLTSDAGALLLREVNALSIRERRDPGINHPPEPGVHRPFPGLLRPAPAEIVLDFDATDDPAHGNQEHCFFHGYYDHCCYRSNAPMSTAAPCGRALPS